MSLIRFSFVLVTLASLSLIGCSGGKGDQPEIGLVSGTVLMDGEPLSSARIIFGPTVGRPSTGLTDKDGHYTLQYLDRIQGAKVGAHLVSITTYYADEDSQEALNAKEKIPAKYNVKSELKQDVKPGKNVIDFDLQSK